MYHRIPEARECEPGSHVVAIPWKISKPIIAVLMMISGFVATYISGFRPHHDGAEPSISLSSNIGTKSLRVSNSYERQLGRKIGDGLYPHLYLVQVQKETQLELEDSSVVSWKIIRDATNETLLDDKMASTFEFTFPEIGAYTIITDDGESTSKYTVTSRIVRWELRTLDETDRGNYFQALHRWYIIEQQEGMLKYGSGYQSMTYLLRQHIYGAAKRDCDHWHDGAGFLNHHIGITWEFEKSLRLIDSTTAAHYWDYTIEYAEDVAWHDSIIFKDDWFGDNSPNNANHVVSRGRFGYLPVMRDARGFSDITNPYGLLRSPWNTNPTAYLLRHNKTIGKLGDEWQYFPNCSQFASYLKDGSTSLAEVSSAINGQLHGPVHIMIGGHWGFHAHANVWDRISSWDTYDTYPFDNYLLFSKFLWRQGFIHVPEHCSHDTPALECTAHCPSAITEKFNASEILAHTGFLHVSPQEFELATRDYFMEEQVEYTQKKMLAALCEVGHPGEMYTSSAPQDPTFWPLHGNAERFVQLIRILAENGKVTFDDTWGYTHERSASDTHIVCDWSNVDGEFDMPTCSLGECPGHREDDLLPFDHLMEHQTGLLSNADFWKLISPNNDRMPYVYDGLTTWTGCRDSSVLVEAGLE